MTTIWYHGDDGEVAGYVDLNATSECMMIASEIHGVPTREEANLIAAKYGRDPAWVDQLCHCMGWWWDDDEKTAA